MATLPLCLTEQRGNGYSEVSLSKEPLIKELDPRSGLDPRLGQEPRFLRDSLETLDLVKIRLELFLGFSVKLTVACSLQRHNLVPQNKELA